MENSIDNEERQKIFSLFITERQLRFSDIERKTGLRSNHLSYHITEMIKAGHLIKQEDMYMLTPTAETLMSKFSQVVGKEQGPLAIVVVAARNQGRLCLLKRNKRPYQGYWGLIGGKMRLSESVQQTALRETLEETGLRCAFKRVAAVLHERVNDEGAIKHAFIIYLCVVDAADTKTKPGEEGQLGWFDIESLPNDIIPSDRYMIESLLDSEHRVVHVILEQKDERIINMTIND
ncbi:MAG: NUDIX domain-containing protein [Nanoarchaeota archaeon]